MGAYVVKDHYFLKAKTEGYVARSAFKLQEIDRAHKIIKPSSVVLDLGSAPGSWLQYLAKKLGPNGLAIGIDLNPITIQLQKNIHTIVGDVFTLTKEAILNATGREDLLGFDVVLSDMAPKTSGIKHVDQTRSLELAKKAAMLAIDLQKSGGHTVIKVFNSEEVRLLIHEMKNHFSEVKQMRPDGIRTESKELYIVGLKKK